MTGARHRSNAELVAQGVANIGSALFGGFCVTGTIARTATNVRAGSRGPVSGMLHALFVLVFMALAAPLAAYIPLAALAGVLAVVAWGMVEKEEMWALVRGSRGDALIVLATFGLVVFRDLTEGIVVGFALAGLVFIKRMSDEHRVARRRVRSHRRRPARRLAGLPPARPVVLWLGRADRRCAGPHRRPPAAFAIDFTEVPMIDSSGARSFAVLAAQDAAQGRAVVHRRRTAAGAPGAAGAGPEGPHVLYLPDLAAAEAMTGPPPDPVG